MRSSPFDPEPIDVYTTDGLPVRVNFKKKIRKIREIADLWRIDDGWWSEPACRIYYVLELDGGSRVTVFHDLLHDKWYRQNWTA